ncbi:hypothetical protein PLICRDRAFT_179863 [Plicaturopsis crispa FD-325 SS-3]|uniref:Unplaced genomic scaffold PLICRscaffold_19, whole genome shotgun sequence n=1 Tax=Plicaturopsis crispa FD-325 SS-3 TaxID=944288 RepID=A0A0C9T7Q6_PLICR|nr:hypothetical protein PLICRDRAFT_179863 [Plicaturopsis crispa FD-325 SS-3]
MALDTIDDDSLIYIFAFLAIPEILALRQTCKRLHAISKLRTACSTHVLAQGFPFPPAPPIHALEERTRHAYRLGSKWLQSQSQQSALATRRGWSVSPNTSGASISDVRFMPGRWLLTVSKGIWSVLTAWDIPNHHHQHDHLPHPNLHHHHDHGGLHHDHDHHHDNDDHDDHHHHPNHNGGLHKIAEWCPKGAGAIFNGFAVNTDPSADADLAISVLQDGYLGITRWLSRYYKMAISVLQDGWQRIELLQLYRPDDNRANDDGAGKGKASFRILGTIKTWYKPVALQGTVLASSDDGTVLASSRRPARHRPRVALHGTVLASPSTAPSSHRPPRLRPRIALHGSVLASPYTAPSSRRATRHRPPVALHGTTVLASSDDGTVLPSPSTAPSSRRPARERPRVALHGTVLASRYTAPSSRRPPRHRPRVALHGTVLASPSTAPSSRRPARHRPRVALHGPVLASPSTAPSSRRATTARRPSSATSDDDAETVICDWRKRACAVLRSGREAGYSSWQHDRCIQVVFAYKSILVVRARSINLFPEPRSLGCDGTKSRIEAAQYLFRDEGVVAVNVQGLGDTR